MEQCVIKGKVTLNPIIDWEDDDVWEFLNDWAKVPHCSLYDEGWRRLGCLGCPLAGDVAAKREFARYPKYKELYIMALERMIKNHPGEIRMANGEPATNGGEMFAEWQRWCTFGGHRTGSRMDISEEGDNDKK